jgi:hypothetical protein
MTADIEEALARRLEDLGVRASREEIRELGSAYPALVAWMRMVEELARLDDDDEVLAE